MKDNIKIYIYAPNYNSNSGGSVVLHRLCHLINQINGFEAYLVPEKIGKINLSNFESIYSYIKKVIFKLINKGLKVNKDWETPVSNKNGIDKEGIVIYPETTFGNPLKIKKVIRWLLHQPGHFSGDFCFGKNELYFKFNSAIKDFEYCYSKTSQQELKVIYYPLDIYNEKNTSDRNVDCHLIRKGDHKEKVHDSKSILLDGLSHSEIAEIFKRSRRFISYDDYTAYSLFAVLCGCESVVIPTPGVTKLDWYPNEQDRYGISYGLNSDELSLAFNTKHLVLKHLEKEHERSFHRVESCLKEAVEYFDR